jgi:hypothetical protein
MNSEKTDTIRKNIEALINYSSKVGLETHVEKTKYMLSHDKTADQNRDIKIGNRSFQNVTQFKYLGMTVPNQNLIQGEIKRRLNSGNACHHSVQNLLSSHLLSQHVQIRIYKTIISPVVLYGCESQSLDIKGGTYTEGVQKQGAEKIISTEGG